MTAADLVDALGLPFGALVERRVPKTLLAENGAQTAADRRAMQEGIEEIRWVAAVKPATAGVPAYRDEVREYLEIAVILLALRDAARASRLVELVHRAVPYPVLLIATTDGSVTLSLAEKRNAQSAAGRVVLDGDVSEAVVDGQTPAHLCAPFLDALSLARQPRGSMQSLYAGWADTAVALNAGRITGKFALPDSPEGAIRRRNALHEIARLDGEIASARRAAAREKRMARRVELNLLYTRLKTAREAVLLDL